MSFSKNTYHRSNFDEVFRLVAEVQKQTGFTRLFGDVRAPEDIVAGRVLTASQAEAAERTQCVAAG